MRYSLDTSAILDGRKRHYPPDIFPALWVNFERLIGDGSIKATEMVRHELERKDDEVLKWCKELEVFIDVDETIQTVVSEILAAHPKLVSEGGQRSFADPFVIALAKPHRCVVVTGESGGTEDRPRIPFVCRAVGVECINMLELIRRERWAF